jgi:CheY-like chemotaxis protein
MRAAGIVAPHAGREFSMSMKERIGPHLPYLRRYARALTGSAQSGDAFVRATLEALVSGEVSIDENVPIRVALYKVFHTIWSGPGAKYDPKTDGALSGGSSPEERLKGLNVLPRQALLLSAVEGFAFSDVGVILGVSKDAAQKLAADAQLEIERELKTDVLVIEDEAIIAMDIKELAEELGHRVTSIARTRDEAVAAARAKKPGLVLADIQLADDSSGIDAVRDILAMFDAPVIFVTAFPERLLTGDRPEPAYLMTKPFERLTLKATIGQALFFHRTRQAA